MVRLRPDRFEALCEFAQQRISGLPAESVVDQAKAIDVSGCDDDLGTAVLGRLQQLRQPLVKQGPVWKARQRVVVRQIGEPLLLADVLEREGDVARKLHQQLHFLVVEEPDLAGVQDKNADRLAAYDQRQSCQRFDPAFQAFLVYHSLRIVLDVARDHGLFFPDPPYLAARLYDPVFRFERFAYHRVLPQSHHPGPVFEVDRFTPKHAALVDLLLCSAEDCGGGGADVQDLARRDRDGPYDVWECGENAAQPLA